MRRLGWMTTPAVVASLGLAVAACGGSPATPTVAHIGSTTTTTAAPTGGGGPGGASLAQATNYAECMRAHGVPSFPDPTPGPGGGYGFEFHGGLGRGGPNPNSASFQAADKKCRSDLPDNGAPRPLSAAQQQDFLNWAACIRTHGVPNFPDPSFSGGGVSIRISAPAGSSGSGSGPPKALQAAQKACASKLPGGFGGPFGG